MQSRAYKNQGESATARLINQAGVRQYASDCASTCGPTNINQWLQEDLCCRPSKNQANNTVMFAENPW
jgi:hypothetical protein